MMQFTTGNLLDSDAEALVNAVNTVGVMGKGIALMFKERFRENFRLYEEACRKKEVQVGKMFVTSVRGPRGPRWIVNFPTKQHWRENSKIEWIESGLKDLRRFLIENSVSSIAVPPLGCGLGGLEWQNVLERIQTILGDLKTDIIVFKPVGRLRPDDFTLKAMKRLEPNELRQRVFSSEQMFERCSRA